MVWSNNNLSGVADSGIMVTECRFCDQAVAVLTSACYTSPNDSGQCNGQVFHTPVPLSPSSIHVIWYLSKGFDALSLGS